jgi:hypothetical protein
MAVLKWFEFWTCGIWRTVPDQTTHLRPFWAQRVFVAALVVVFWVGVRLLCVCVLSFYFYAQSQIIYKRSNLALMSMWMWTLLCHLVTVHFRVHFTGSWFCSLAGMYMYEGETKAMQAHAMRVYVVQKQ